MPPSPVPPSPVPPSPVIERDELDVSASTVASEDAATPPEHRVSSPSPSKAAVTIEDGAIATARLPTDEWQQLRARHGLSITQRRLFIRNPKPVRVDFAPLNAARQRQVRRVAFDLGLAKPVTVEVSTVVEHSAGAYSLAGKIEGDPLSEFSVSIYEDAVVGTFQSKDIGVRQLRYAGEKIHRVEQVIPGLAPACGTPLVAEPPPEGIAAADPLAGDVDADSDGWPDKPFNTEADRAGSAGASAAAAGSPANPATGTTLDIFVAYTQGTIANEGSLNALLALINQGIVDTNLAFQASGIDTSARLVGTGQVSYGATD